MSTCQHGHTRKTSGCVSCELLWQRSIENCGYCSKWGPCPEHRFEPVRYERLMLNAYGRQCWDAGYEAGKRDASPSTDPLRAYVHDVIAAHLYEREGGLTDAEVWLRCRFCRRAGKVSGSFAYGPTHEPSCWVPAFIRDMNTALLTAPGNSTTEVATGHFCHENEGPDGSCQACNSTNDWWHKPGGDDRR